jgi:AcrR family transcriptional regulator
VAKTATIDRASPPRDMAALGRPRGDTAERILAAATDLVAKVGVDGLRLADVGATLGISAPAIYAHFPGGRGELIDRIAQDGVRGMEAFFPRRGGPALIDLLEGVSDLVRFYAANRAFLRIMLLDFSSPLGHPSITREIGAPRGQAANGAFLPMFGRLDDILAGCAGEGRATEVSGNILLNILIGATALNLIYPPQPQARPEQITRAVEAIVRDLVVRYLGLSVPDAVDRNSSTGATT